MNKLLRLFLISVAVGIVSGLAARGVETGVQWAFSHMAGPFAGSGRLDEFAFHWQILLMTVGAGALSGVILGLFCRPSEALATEAYVRAFHVNAGQLPLRDSIFKAFGAIGVIGLGGSMGKEGPIAVLGAAIGSSLSNVLRLTPRERRLFLVAGCAAGVGAIFQCPLGGAIFATTVLYREPEIEADALMPSIIASVISYSMFMAFGGYGLHMLPATDTLKFTQPVELLAYTALGIFCALTAIGLFYSFRLAHRVGFRRRTPRWLAPALGALLAGVLAGIFPQITGPGYAFLERIMEGSLFGSHHSWLIWAALLALVLAAKCLATAFMYGSGNAGGIFGPTLFIGGLAGAVIGALLEVIFPGTFPEPLRQALIPVGMAGVLSASFRVPLAAIVMIIEMTGSYGLIVPLMLVSVLAYALAWRWGVNHEQVAAMSQSPAHAGESLVSILQNIRVEEVFERSWPYVVPPAATLTRIIAEMPMGGRPVFVVLDGRRVQGVISPEDVAQLAAAGSASNVIVAVDLMNSDPVRIPPGETLYAALDLFTRHGSEALVVVDPETQDFLGVLPRSSIHRAVRQAVELERSHLLKEHSSIAALDHDRQLEALLSRLPQANRGTVQKIAVPEDAAGRSLRESDFRKRYGWEVIAIQPASGELQAPPDPSRPLKKDDTLIVLLGPS